MIRSRHLRAGLLACALSLPGAAWGQGVPQAQPGSPLPSVRLWGGYELSDTAGNLWGSAPSVVTLCPNVTGTGQGFAQVCPGTSPGNPLYVSGGGSGSAPAPSGTVGTAYTGANQATPVFDATTGLGLLTAGTALPAGTNTIGAVAQGTPGLAANPWPVVDTRRVTLTQTQVPVPATTSTLLLAANPARKSLRIAGTNAADSFRLGYGVAATASSSALFGSGGVFTAEQYGPGDGVPTGAIYGYSTAGFTAQVGEGN